MNSVNMKKLSEYAEASTSLAESIAKDLVADRYVSDETVIALNTFVTAALEVSALLDLLDIDPKESMN